MNCADLLRYEDPVLIQNGLEGTIAARREESRERFNTILLGMLKDENEFTEEFAREIEASNRDYFEKLDELQEEPREDGVVNKKLEAAVWRLSSKRALLVENVIGNKRARQVIRDALRQAVSQ